MKNFELDPLILLNGDPEFLSLSIAFKKILNLYINQCKIIENLNAQKQALAKEKRDLKLDNELQKIRKANIPLGMGRKNSSNNRLVQRNEEIMKKEVEILPATAPRTNSRTPVINSDFLSHNDQSIFNHFMHRDPQNTSEDNNILHIIQHFNDKVKFSEQSLAILFKELNSNSVSKSLAQIAYLKDCKVNYQISLQEMKNIYHKILPLKNENINISQDILKEIDILKKKIKKDNFFKGKICQIIQIAETLEEEDIFYEIEALGAFKKLFQVQKDDCTHTVVQEIFLFVHEIKNFLEVT